MDTHFAHNTFLLCRGMRERLSFAGIWLARPKIPDGPKHDFLPRKKTNGHEQPRSVPSGSTKSRIGSRHALIVYVQGFDMIIYPSALKNVLPPLVLQRSTGLDEIVLQTAQDFWHYLPWKFRLSLSVLFSSCPMSLLACGLLWTLSSGISTGLVPMCDVLTCRRVYPYANRNM